MSGVLILGAGGHAKVIADILMCRGILVRGFLDDDRKFWGETRLGLPVLGAIDLFPEYEPEGLIIGVGDNSLRRRVARLLNPHADGLLRNAIHPKATVAESVQMGKGVVVCAGAVINPDAILGNHVIVNTAATVDHDCAINDFAHIAPGRASGRRGDGGRRHISGNRQFGDSGRKNRRLGNRRRWLCCDS